MGLTQSTPKDMELAPKDMELELLELGDTTRVMSSRKRSANIFSGRSMREEIPVEPPDFNYQKAFAIMSERRVQRSYKGIYTKYSMWSQIFTWALVAYIFGVLVTDVARSAINGDQSLTWDNLILAFIGFLVVFVIVEIALVIRWMIYWVIIAELIMFVQTGSLKSMFWLDKKISDKDHAVRRGIMVFLIVMESLTISWHVLTHHLYPWIVRKQLLDPKWWWRVRRGHRQNSFTYRTKARIWTDKRSLVRYCGGLNAAGEPHGYGVWTDTSFHGEHLRGVWENGVPIGPFSSREHGSGYCFVNLRIAYCQNRGETSPDQIYWLPTPSSEGLRWGVASVECSVSGGFFRFLPSVHHLTGPNNGTEPMDARDCQSVLRTPICELRTAEERRTLIERKRSSFLPSALQPPPSIGGRALREGDTEALVFLHGYNCSLDYALNRLGQLLALGDFPPHIHPFIFSWPSGSTLAYFQARSTGCESEKTANDFAMFLRSLLDAGYQQINIIAHSMGARIYFSALERGLLDDIFENLRHTESTGTNKALLSTLTLCNPDYERHRFVRPSGGYDLSRQFCELITVYGDRMDNALIWSELLSRNGFFDALVWSMGKRIYSLHRDPTSSPTRDSRWSIFRQDTSTQAIEIGAEAAEINDQCAFPGVCSVALNHLNTNSASYVAQTDDATITNDDAPHDFLDVDVVDTTWMDHNVHAVRHNYFNLNPTMIDDLRQVIVSKRRARFRAGLMHTVANVHIFLVAPSHVKND